MGSRRRIAFVMVVAFVLVVVASAEGAAAGPEKSKALREGARDAAMADPATTFVPGEILVRFRKGVSASERAVELDSQGATLVRELAAPGVVLAQLAPGKGVQAAVAAFSRRADVAYADPDLAPNMWSNPGEIAGNGLDDDGNGKIDDARGWDFNANDNDPRDTNGHGTHVSGTIGAKGNNATGVVGVNWNVTIMPVRVLGPTGGTNEQVSDGFAYAAAEGAK